MLPYNSSYSFPLSQYLQLCYAFFFMDRFIIDWNNNLPDKTRLENTLLISGITILHIILRHLDYYNLHVRFINRIKVILLIFT